MDNAEQSSSTNIRKKPVIAILGGTGKEGTGLGLRWASAGYEILIGSRQLEKAEAAAAELNEKLSHFIGVGPAPSPSLQGGGLGVGPALPRQHPVRGLENAAAARQADICVLTVVQAAHQSALEGLRDDLQGKILVDATARVEFRDPRPPSPPSAARIAQEILGAGVRVVAAFQNVPAHVLKKNLGQALDTDVLVCADDPQAAQQVIQLAEAGGMRGYFAGGLDNALVVEGLTCLLISLNQRYGVKTASIAVTGIPQS